MKKIELICGGLAILSVVGGLFLIPGSSALLFIAMIILSCFYFFFSFALFNEIAIVKILSKGSYQGISSLRILGSIFTGFGLSISSAAIIFVILELPGAGPQLIIGFFLLSCSLIVVTLKSWNNKSRFYKKLLIRLAAFG